MDTIDQLSIKIPATPGALGGWLRQAREQKGITQQDLAMALGVSRKARLMYVFLRLWPPPATSLDTPPRINPGASRRYFA